MTAAAPPSRRASRAARLADPGFTLLEVMVAVAILGLSLSVILSAQVGLFSTGTYGQHLAEALGLGRCKMTELEEGFLKLGYPEVDTSDEGACCAGDLRQDMRCSWKIERIELPNPPPFDPTADGGVSPASSAPGGGLGPMGMLTQASNTLPGVGEQNGMTGLANPGQFGGLMGAGTNGMAGLMTAGASAGVGALAPMVMGIVYPSLKPMLEASIRKVTVTVKWREGLSSRDVELVQWVTNPTRGGLLSAALGADSAGLPGMPGLVPPAGGGNVVSPSSGGGLPGGGSR